MSVSTQLSGGHEGAPLDVMIGLVWSFLSSVTAENDHVIDCDFQATPLLMLTRRIYLDIFAFNEKKKKAELK